MAWFAGKSLTGVFHGLLLFTLLACDTLIYRIRRTVAAKAGERNNEHYALLIAATLNAGTVFAIAALGLLINEIRHRQPRRRGHDALRRHRRLRHGRYAYRQRLAGVCCRHGRWRLLAGLFALHWSSGSTPISTPPALPSLFGAGFSAFVGTRYVQEKLPGTACAVPGLADIPFIGPALFKQHPMVCIAIAVTVGIIWFLYRTRAGLVLRSVGESPESACTGLSGAPHPLAVLFGGAMCGLAGAYLAVIPPLWVEGMVASKGLDCAGAHHLRHLAALRVLFGAYLFGDVTMMQFTCRVRGVDIPSPVSVDGAIRGDHRRAGTDFA